MACVYQSSWIVKQSLSVADNYMFGGTSTRTQPVGDGSTILNSTTNSDGTKKAGLTQLVADQIKADVGSSGMGHLSSQATGTVVTLSEDAAARPAARLGLL